MAKKQRKNTSGKKTGKKNKSNKGKSDKDFSEFFKNHSQEVKNQDMSKMERAPLHRRRNILIFVFITLILVAAAAVFGFFIFTRENKFTGEKINVDIAVSPRVSSGDEISLDITVSNMESVDLKQTELALRFPEGFKFSSAQPAAANEFNNAWELGRLESGEETKIIIRGQLVGEVNMEKLFLATLSYIPANFNSLFQKSINQKVIIASSAIDLGLQAPDGAVNDQEIEFKINYQNTADEELERVRLIVNYPDGFQYQSAEPAPRSGSNNIWQDDFLSDQEEKTVTVKGIISGEVGAMKEVTAQVGVIKEDSTFSLQIEKRSLFTIIEPASDLQLTVNSEYEDSLLSWDDQLEYSLKFQNSGDIVLNDIELSVDLEQEPINFVDWDSLQEENNSRLTDNQISWGPEQIPELARVRPGDQVEIFFQVGLQDFADLPIEEEQTGFLLKSQAVAESNSLADTGGSYSQESNLVTSLLSSQVTFSAEGRYYDQDLQKVGRGPLPPERGATTVYRIIFSIQNSSNLIEEVEIKTKLAKNAEWLGNSAVTPGGNLNYDEETDIITWQIEQLPAYLGYLAPEARAYFEVSINPSQKEVGKLVALTDLVEFTAIDAVTEEEISLTDALIDTNLETDVGAEGKGVVIEGSGSDQEINSNLNSNINTNNSDSNTNSQ